MRVAWYWWGFRVYADDQTVQQLIRAVEQGEPAVRELLTRLGYGWLGELVRILMMWGVQALRAMYGQCGGRGLQMTVPWSLWGAYISCG
jgi:hypothetical protein